MGNKEKMNKKRFFYPNEFMKMYDFLNKNGKFTADLQIQTGCRINEARGFLKTPIFDSTEGRHNITLIHTKCRARKGQKRPEPRTIPLNRKFFYDLKKIVDENKLRVLSTNAMNIQLKKACELAEIKNPEEFSSHNLRKTFGTWLLALGVPMSKVAQHLDHTEKVLKENYATNDVFSNKDKDKMLRVLRELPEKLLPYAYRKQ